MRVFNLKAGDPLSLILAADARLTTTNYCNDQIWELSWQAGVPPALAVTTTYGLRALSMRMFPRFIEAGVSISNPEDFAEKPVLKSIFPNALEVHYAPFSGLGVIGEYWVAGSDIIAGRIRITNSSPKKRRIVLEWVALLYASDSVQTMKPDNIEHVAILNGKADGLTPLIFMSGGVSAHNSPYPALSITLDLPPGKSGQNIWCQVARSNPLESFQDARAITASSLDAEFARISLCNSSQIEIITGDAEWNAAFAVAQKCAVNFLMSPTSNLPRISFVSSRRMDEGYSLKGDGSDYDRFWNGQTPLETAYLSDFFLPSEPSLVEGFLMNFLSSQNDTGEIDWKPGLGGQRSGRLATPILATLAWRLYQYTSDQNYLGLIFSPLLKFFNSWFTPIHDRDQDGIPEWEHPLQSGFADHPLFSRWHSWAHGVDITTAESPALCAFLYRECESLIKIAQVLGRQTEIPPLKVVHDRLRTEIETFWSTNLSTFHYRDRELHNSPDTQLIAECQGACILEMNINFAQPVRLVFTIETEDETTRRPQFFVHGSSPSGRHRVEHISADKILWFPGWGSATSEKVYANLEYINVRGLNAKDRLRVRVAGYSTQDITNLLPLWAGMISKDMAQLLIEKHILEPSLFWKPFGLPFCPHSSEDLDPEVCQVVNLPVCSLIAHGMLEYGYRQEAADLLTRMMSAIIRTLKKETAFREYYHAETGEGLGERNALTGLPPIGLFFKALGVQIISHDKVLLEGFNPFQWSITLKYQGLTILRGFDKTEIIFRNGQTFSTDDKRPQVISLENL